MNIRQIKKARFVGFTALVASLAMIATLLAANPWVNAGQWAWRIIEGTGTMITYGQLLNEINKPNGTESKLRARPEFYAEDTTLISGAYSGNTFEGSAGSTFSAGNYARYDAGYIYIILDPSVTMGYRSFPGPTRNGGEWISKQDWDAIYANPASAAKSEDDDFRWWEDDAYSRGGYWLVIGASSKTTYHDVVVESEVWNPAWLGTTLDGQLVNAARKLNLRYDVKLHFKIRPLTWTTRADGSAYWRGGKWVTGVETNTFPGYKDATWDVPDSICPQNHEISSEEVRGGMDIWWNKNIEYVNAVLETRSLNSQGQPTGPITTHDGKIQQNVSWVPDYSTKSTDPSFWFRTF